MSTYPRTLVDVTHRPYDPVATVSRLISAINYGAAYEDTELQDANDAVLEYWYTVQSDVGNDDIASEAIDRITDILSDHGYSLSVADDYPGLWIISTGKKDSQAKG